MLQAILTLALAAAQAPIAQMVPEQMLASQMSAGQMSRGRMTTRQTPVRTRPVVRRPSGGVVLPAPRIALKNGNSTAMDMLRCLADARVPLGAARMGGPVPGFPENALETFANTLAQVPVLIEAGVQLTRDGIPILMHDSTLDRTTTATGRVSDTDWGDIRVHYLIDNAGTETDFRVPTLDQAITMMEGRGILVLNVREDDALAPVARAIAAADARGFVIVNLYRPEQAGILHAIDPDVSLILPLASESDLEALEQHGVRLDRVAAWTGIDRLDERQPQLWRLLARRHMPVVFATLFVTDRTISETGDPSPWRELARAGVDVIPSDLAVEIGSVLTSGSDAEAAIRRCDGGTADGRTGSAQLPGAPARPLPEFNRR